MSKAFDFADLTAALIKVIGENDETQGVKHWLSTGYLPLDQAVSGLKEGGGLPSGRIIEVAGPPSAGKTALATQVMIAAQQAGGIAAFHDHERSFDVVLARKLGLRTDTGQWLFKTPRTFEDSIMLFMNAARTIRGSKFPKDAPLVWVFDSLASMIPQSQLEKEMTKQGMADQTALARVTSLHFKVLALLAEELDVCVVFLNQTRTKPGVVYGDPTTTPGGDAPKFYASVRIMLSAARISEGSGEGKEVVGSEVTAKIIKNKVNRPFLRTKWQFMFRPDGSGYFDTVGSLLDVLVEKGVLSKAGPGRIAWVDGTKPHRKELVEKLTSNPAGAKILEKLLVKAGVEVEHDAEAAKLAAEAALDPGEGEAA